MGSLRRRLTALAVLAPRPAFADACAQVRPMWTGPDAASMLDEAIALFATVPSLILIFATLLAIRFRHAWAGAIVTVLWSFLVFMVISRTPGETELAALEQGCIGQPTLFIASVIAICAGTILYTAPNRAPDQKEDDDA